LDFCSPAFSRPAAIMTFFWRSSSAAAACSGASDVAVAASMALMVTQTVTAKPSTYPLLLVFMRERASA
jgi:hypothetical protein